MDIDVEYRELSKFERDLNALPKGFMREVEQVVSKGCLNIKGDWRRRWEGHPHIPYLPRAVSYDVNRAGFQVFGEVGPDKDKPQGPLGNIIEFGDGENAPIPAGVPALEEEEPKFVRALADLGEKAPTDRGPR